MRQQAGTLYWEALCGFEIHNDVRFDSLVTGQKQESRPAKTMLFFI